MARFRHPCKVGLPFDDWPDIDRDAWRAANKTGDIFTDGGLASAWKPKTRLTVMKAYGNWLRFLKDAGRIHEGQSIGDRLTTENLRDYIAALRQRLSPVTIVTQLRSLSQAIRALTPDTDRGLLKSAISRLQVSASPSRDKVARLVSPISLLHLGQRIMEAWRSRNAHDRRLNDMDFRDGLMIVLLALCPLRLANLAQIRIGQHLLIGEGSARLRFAPHETKGGKSLDVPFPEELLPHLRFYLRTVHPKLSADPETETALWPSLHNRPLTEHGIYTRITHITDSHFGHPVTPHMFRDAAATFIAEMTPDRAHMAAAVLQHRSFGTTQRHYIHGQQHKASHLYQAAIDELIAKPECDGRLKNGG